MKYILVIFKIIGSIAILKMAYVVVGIISLILAPIAGLIWLLGLLATIGIIIQFWKNNDQFWTVIWKTFLLIVVWWIMKVGIGFLLVMFEVIANPV
jgi:hypothetical protein